MNKMMSLDEAIRAAFIWEAECVCTPDVMNRVVSGFCDKLIERKIMMPEDAEKMRRNLTVPLKGDGHG